MIEKSFKEISWQVDEPTYREDPAYSYSTLAKFNREGFAKLDTLFDKTTSSSLTFGSMVDTLLTDGEEAFNDRFFVAKFPEVSEKIVFLSQTIFHSFGESYSSIYDIPDSNILDIAKQLEYQPRWKDQTRVDDIKAKGAEYYSQLCASNGKEVVSETDYQDCLNCIDVLRTSEATRDYFSPCSPWENKEKLYQLKFKGTYHGINLRCMADLIIVDYDKKTIQPCDLKTSSHAEYDFFKSFIQWNYFIQAQLYWYILRQNMDKDEYFKDFELLPYVFIVVNRTTLNPLTWVYADTTCEEDIYYGDTFCRNWRNIVKELDFYLNNPTKVPIGITCNKPNDIVQWLNSRQ